MELTRPSIEVIKHSASFKIKGAISSTPFILKHIEYIDDLEVAFAEKAIKAQKKDEKVFFESVRYFCKYAHDFHGELVTFKEIPFGITIVVAFNTLEELLTFRNFQNSIVNYVMSKNKK